jgi:hypothetical protein
MNDGKKLCRQFGLASLGLMIIICLGAANTASTKAAQPPIHRAGPLAEPRSPQQVGLPVDQTQAVIPPDNPQTPEKIALESKWVRPTGISTGSSARQIKLSISVSPTPSETQTLYRFGLAQNAHKRSLSFPRLLRHRQHGTLFGS